MGTLIPENSENFRTEKFPIFRSFFRIKISNDKHWFGSTRIDDLSLMVKLNLPLTIQSATIFIHIECSIIFFNDLDFIYNDTCAPFSILQSDIKRIITKRKNNRNKGEPDVYSYGKLYTEAIDIRTIDNIWMREVN